MTLRNKAQSGYYSEYAKHSSEDLTIREIWEKTSNLGSLSNAYYVIKTNGLPYKKAQRGRGFKHLDELKQLDTANLTIKQMMGKLGLKKTSDYVTIVETLNANKMPYKRAKFITKHETTILGLDTANMTAKDIAKAIGFTEEWQLRKLYQIIERLGITYQRAKS